MEQITAMKIIGLTLTNFRNHTNPVHFDFGDISYITGHNGSGKTTMAHAICYALYGVSYYGEQKIERLLHEKSSNTSVQLRFSDQNGIIHTLVRSRTGDKTSLTLDTYTIRQTDIDRGFCDKKTFLSMFNPTYLVENLGDEGRNLILKYLRPINASTVLQHIPAYSRLLEGIDLDAVAPEKLIRDYREAVHRVEDQSVALSGQIEEIQLAIQSSSQKLGELYGEKRSIEARLDVLLKKQFDGIDRDDLAIQAQILMEQLYQCSSKEDAAIIDLRQKIAALEQKIYVSKFTQSLSDTKAEYKALVERYRTVQRQLSKLTPGTNCPTCMRPITTENLQVVQEGLQTELQRITQRGKEVQQRGQEIAALDSKAKTTFEQFRTDDLAKLNSQLNALESQSKSTDIAALRDKLDSLERMRQHGCLTDEEVQEINNLQATLTGVQAQITAVSDLADESHLESAKTQQEVFAQQIRQYKDIITALTEYMCKKTELATASLQMPHVGIRLFDVFRTTGEVVNAFRFDYNGRDYRTLSLSEKTLAGVEIAAMVRAVTGIDCPICIDNTESVAAFHAETMPSQTLLLRFVKGAALSVQVRNADPTAVQPITLQKAS